MTKQYNVNIVGNLTNNDGVISGFSSNDYMTITNTAYVPQGGNWELVMCVTTGNTISDSNIYAPNPWEHGVYIGLNNGYFSYLVGDVGNGWLNPSQGYIATSYSVLTNTTYYLKVTCDINNSGYYFFHYSLDGQNWVQLLQCSSTNQVAVNPHDIGVGFSGSIDLNKCYLKIDDTTVWQGTTTVSNIRTKIQLRHDTAANWTSVNPILLEGEVGIETDTRKQKFGDGVTAWNSLSYDAGSTALQSITSSDVTTALGYTPVNKAGDTMTGRLITTAEYGTISPVTKGGLPSSNVWKTLIENKSENTGSGWDNILSILEEKIGTDGSNEVFLRVGQNITSSTNSASLTLGIDTNGNQWCTFPNTTCCDGQWVANNGQVASNVSLSIGTDQEIEYDISSYLPNDSYSYEVRFSIGVQTGSGSGAGISANLLGKAANGSNIWVRVADTYARGSWIMVVGNSVVVPINTTRKVVFKYSAVSKAAILNYIYVEAYRRIGTNS